MNMVLAAAEHRHLATFHTEQLTHTVIFHIFHYKNLIYALRTLRRSNPKPNSDMKK